MEGLPMKKTSKNLNKGIIVNMWNDLVMKYNQLQENPNVKLLLALIWALFKIIISIIVKKFF